MMDRRVNETAGTAPSSPRWLLLALGMVLAHQIQSAIVVPEERRFRAATTTAIALMPLTLRLPTRGRGALWAVLALPPLFGAFAGHLVPIVRDRIVPPASETAPLNLAGAALLLALGLAELRSADAVSRMSAAERR